MRVSRQVCLMLWAFQLCAYGNPTGFADLASPAMRYRHNPQAMAVFGADLGNDPEVTGRLRSELYFKYGRAYFRAKRYPDAILNYSHALGLHPTSAAFNNRGLAYWSENDFDAARQDFSSALQLDPRDPNAAANLGKLQVVQKQYDAAIASFTVAIDNGRRRADIYLGRGDAYRLSGHMSNAIDDYDQAIALDPSSSLGYFGRAQARYDAGNPDAALVDVTTASKLDPDTPNSVLLRALLLFDLKRYGDALSDYSAVLKRWPNQALAWKGRAATYSSMSNWPQAIADYSNAIAIDPKNDRLYRSRGIAYAHQENNDAAIADFNDAIRLAPRTTDGYTLLASRFRAIGRTQTAIDTLSRALTLIPGNADLYEGRAVYFEHQGNYGAAIRDYQAMARIDPANVSAWIWLADDEAHDGLYETAARDYDVADRLSRDNKDVLHGRGELLLFKGDWRSADSIFDRWQNLFGKSEIQANSSSPYYIAIWRHFIALYLANDDHTLLAREASELKTDRWPFPVLDFYMGQTTEAGLLSAANQGDPKERPGQVCEADTYLGEWRLANRDFAGARKNFEAAATVCPPDFTEAVFVRQGLLRTQSNLEGRTPP